MEQPFFLPPLYPISSFWIIPLGHKGNLFSFSFLFFFPSFLFFFFALLALHPRQMEVPRLGIQSELQLPACTTATAMQDPSHICALHHSSRKRQIPDPLSEARDWTRILTDTSWIHFQHHNGNSFFFLPSSLSFFSFFLSFIDLQCCANFYCTAKWPSRTYIYILFLPSWSIPRDWL